MLKKIKIKLQYLLPKQGLTQLAGWLADQKAAGLTQLMIKLFAKFYKVDMAEAKESEFSAYSTFNEFFTRPLKQNIRPIVAATNQLALPADGVISQLGLIIDDQILQAKGHSYSLEVLLAGNYILTEQFQNGLFVTTYLSPRDYHRVHMPCDGLLTEMIYVPGDLFSVNQLTATNVPNLFARNERLICIFETSFGKMAQILIGAAIVGSIDTSWCGCVNNQRDRVIKRWTYPEKDKTGAVYLKKGEEMGKFKLGSTVINLFESNHIKLNSALEQGSVTRVGELLAESIYPNTEEPDPSTKFN
ncbi:Phosphatidylserine decarboxylase proenzyme [Arsenophonus endosymbiont of Aleurodicus floccissimus]|uniref:archaetidylserine decarboxylase n=1 Tax=Arsenophonus endosymbiont of Aleurodicus floccissimus TaxID=2152761 RepID=UPI000E6B0398|nr:archaetidylserine decarboxylase [Arsenophonus endosymbiont of Aleurodicus floccissimus]SPP32029.1 Phosphatidylserine decarboxylase proenzyme [Arsenophonus endosymbiont of Aleurodicus floccissimus]